MLKLASIMVIGVLFSTAVSADDDDWGEHHHRHHRHHHHRHHHHRHDYYSPRYQEEIVYVPQPVVEYVPVQPRYYAPPPQVGYYGYDQRSPQGLLGGMVGSAVGYELGRGDPVAAGIGAAAGAWFGNSRY